METLRTPEIRAGHARACVGIGLIALLLLLLALAPVALHAAEISGSLEQWHPLTVDFTGPQASDTDDSPNPFMDYRLNVEFTSPSGQLTVVPGFFAGDGAGGASGDVWRVRFAPDEAGTWNFVARFRNGDDVAISLAPDAGAALPPDGEAGTATITALNENAPGFLRWGRLEYVGGHYLKFRDGPYWIKGAVDSPENFLGFAGFHNTEDQNGDFLHEYEPHRGDFVDGDPLFENTDTGVDSRGIIGALNYLGEAHINSIYFLPMNLGGDGQDAYPFVGPLKNAFDKTHYDVKKLYQWYLTLNHAQEQGVASHFVLAETEAPNENWLDDGDLGRERKLYYRELIARFGFLLAGKWNLSEENDYSISRLEEFADYLQALDWSNKPIAVHTKPNNFSDYEQIVGDSRFSATSIQYDPNKAGDHVENWRENSANTGRPWVLDMDENSPAGTGLDDTNAEDLRKRVLYDVYFSGGNIEWYFGYHDLPLGGDLRTEDFRTRAEMFQYMWFARRFMQQHLPFWAMNPNDGLLQGEDGSFGGGEVLAQPGGVYAIYLPDASQPATLDLTADPQTFVRRWFNPESGEFEGELLTLIGGSPVSLGAPPSRGDQDWVALVLRDDDAPPSPPPDFGVTELALIDADADTPIMAFDPLESGVTINLATLPTRNLNVVARTAGSVGSVQFQLDGALFSTENVEPFALAGDAGGDFNPWTPPPGDLQIGAVAYSLADGGGEIGNAVTVNVTFIDEAEPLYTLAATDPGEAGVENVWRTQAGSPTGFNLLFFGTGAGATEFSLGDCTVTLDIEAARPLTGALADESGAATMRRTLPEAIAGRTFAFQALDYRSCSVSNAAETAF